MIGYTVWQHVKRTEEPPVYDAITYFQKARNFWDVVEQRKFTNPLNIEPTSRPPGTILMSYPFGFELDFRPFYFRSIFVPILCLVFAIYLVGFTPGKLGPAQWDIAIFASLASAMPTFYQFEPLAELPNSTYWGLVDNFMAGVAALAAASCLHSIRTISCKWIIASGFLASLCFLIKPAGILVMGLVGISWFMIAVFHFRSIGKLGMAEDSRRFLTFGLVSFGAIYAVILAWCLSSKYFSAHNISFGTSAIAVMKTELALGAVSLIDLVYRTFGWALLVAMAVSLFGFWRLGKRYTETADLSRGMVGGLVAAATLAVGVGTWFWIVMTGGVTQIRYFVPFAFMALIYVLPLCLEAVPYSPWWAKLTFRAWCLFLPMNLTLLLLQAHPSVDWQRWSGVNLMAGASNEIVAKANEFLRQAMTDDRDRLLYSMRTGQSDAVLLSVSAYQETVQRSRPYLGIRRPLDWQRTTVVRFNELVDSDFLMFEPVTDQNVRKEILGRRSIEHQADESWLFQSLFTEMGESEGVRIVSRWPSGRIVEIFDRSRLELALDDTKGRHIWRRVFMDANPRRWWSETDLEHWLSSRVPIVRNVHFGSVFKIHALDVIRSPDEMTIHFWWEPLQVSHTDLWSFFFHVLDEQGRIISMKELMVRNRPPVFQDQRIRLDIVTFPDQIVEKAQTFGVGVHRPRANTLLIADKGTRDWDNKRVIIPVTNIRRPK